jgi:outer membrane protein assembly factor BamA
LYTNLYQFNVSYPFDEIRSLRATVGLRNDRGVLRPYDNASGFPDPNALAFRDTVSKFIVSRLEYVHDNTINPTQNIWKGLRYKVFLDVNMPTFKSALNNGKATLNLGFDARYYKKLYRNFIWAGRAAADFSWGEQKIVYFLGGTDGWLGPKFNENPPAPDQSYAFQSLALNMRGYNQNVANGNNAVVINSEFRFPLFSTLINRPINNAFLRNFQVVQFVDLGTAWNGKYNGITRPGEFYSSPTTPVAVRIDAGGLGPFAGGYGFGLRSTLLGYFLRVDAAWPMKGVFVGKPVWYFSLGFDF